MAPEKLHAECGLILCTPLPFWGNSSYFSSGFHRGHTCQNLQSLSRRLEDSCSAEPTMKRSPSMGWGLPWSPTTFLRNVSLWLSFSHLPPVITASVFISDWFHSACPAYLIPDETLLLCEPIPHHSNLNCLISLYLHLSASAENCLCPDTKSPDLQIPWRGSRWGKGLNLELLCTFPHSNLGVQVNWGGR